MVARTNGWGITLLVMVLLANLLCNNNGLDGSTCFFFVGWCTLLRSSVAQAEVTLDLH